MKKMGRILTGVWVMCVAMACFWAETALAVLPKAPVIAGAAGSDYIKIANGVFTELLDKGINLLFVGSMVAYCGGAIYLFMQAKKSHEWGNFFKGLGVGGAVLILILILLTQARTALA